VVKDEKRGVALLEDAAMVKGHPGAQCNLGHMYRGGEGGLTEDHVRAAELFTMAAEQGDAEAQHSLAAMHMSREGGLDPLDQARVMSLLTQAAEGGEADAQFRLGFILTNTDLNYDARRRAKGVALWEQAAAQGHATAKEMLAQYDANVEALTLILTRRLSLTNSLEM